MGKYDRAIESGPRALAIAETSGDFALQVTTNFFLSMIYHSLGKYRCASVSFMPTGNEGDLCVLRSIDDPAVRRYNHGGQR
jgi:hypothetical protein